MLASLVTAGAVMAAPAAALATKPAHKGKNKTAHGCMQARNAPFIVHGTFVSAVADDPATPASEATVTLKLTGASGHAKRSGDIADQDAVKPGVQVKGAEYTVAAGDAFTLKLNRFEGTDTPSVGDKVRVRGRIAVTKKRCAPAGTSVADRHGAVDIRRVVIGDRDADA